MAVANGVTFLGRGDCSVKSELRKKKVDRKVIACSLLLILVKRWE